MAHVAPRAFGPGVREVLGDDEFVEIGDDDGMTLLRPATAARALLVMHQVGPGPAAVLDDADRLGWLAGRSPGPAVLATGRADAGEETVVIRLATDAAPATRGHPMGAEALIEALAGGLRSLHSLDVDQCPFDAGPDRLRQRLDDRLERGEIDVATDGPYAGRMPADLAAIFDELTVELGPIEKPVFIHGGLRADRVWFDPSGSVTFTGWRHGGVGDRHLDLAAAAALVTDVHGPALVAPLLDAYGIEEVDLRRLDAHQLLAHLLA
jgi:aminoglycoside phosphotransferase